MAKPRSKSRRRGNTSTANVRSTSRSLPFTPDNYRLMDIEDRRLFHPDDTYAPSQSLPTSRTRIITRPRRQARRSGNLNGSLPKMFQPVAVVAGFRVPKKVAICIRRKMRKEVLHALRKAGKVGQKRPRRSYYSDIHC